MSALLIIAAAWTVVSAAAALVVSIFMRAASHADKAADADRPRIRPELALVLVPNVLGERVVSELARELDRRPGRALHPTLN